MHLKTTCYRGTENDEYCTEVGGIGQTYWPCILDGNTSDDDVEPESAWEVENSGNSTS